MNDQICTTLSNSMKITQLRSSENLTDPFCTAAWFNAPNYHFGIHLNEL